MRIIFVTNLYPPVLIGGYELACANVADALTARGHDIRVLTTWCHLPQKTTTPAWVRRELALFWLLPYKSKNETVEGRDLHSAVCSSYSNTLRLLNNIQEFRPDLVSIWNPLGVGGLAMMDLLNLIGVPWSLHLGDRVPVDIVQNVPDVVRGLFNAHGNNLYERARILSVSQHLLDEIETVSGISFPHGADIVAGWADLSHAVPHELYLQEGRARFVAAGGIYPHKGIDLMLGASARLKAEGVNFSLDLYGDGELPHYIDMTRSLQLQDRVRFMGPRAQSQLLPLFSGYDAFLCPTWERDPFPFAPLEAAGCGTPPIVTRNCGTSERLVDGVHCVKIDRTVEQLTEAMARVAAGQVDLARMGRAGQRLMKTDLSFERYLDRVEAALSNHARPWPHGAAGDPTLPLLAFLKHNLSVFLRFG
jgi:glycosyltransferase involved in cell wall biosynthesis